MKYNSKQMKKDFKEIIELLQQMKKNPEKYRLLSYSWFREVVEDPLETNCRGGGYTCYKQGPIIDIRLTINVKDEKPKR